MGRRGRGGKGEEDFPLIRDEENCGDRIMVSKVVELVIFLVGCSKKIQLSYSGLTVGLLKKPNSMVK